MRKLGVVMSSVVLLVGLCWAQEKPLGAGGPDRPAFRMPVMEGDIPIVPEKIMVKELGLDTAQQQQVRGILSSRQNDMQTLRAKMDAAARTQAELISQESPDVVAVFKEVDEIARLRADMAKIRIEQVLAVQNILTPEQRAKLREKMKERMERRDVKREHPRKGAAARLEPQPAPDATAPAK